MCDHNLLVIKYIPVMRRIQQFGKNGPIDETQYVYKSVFVKMIKKNQRRSKHFLSVKKPKCLFISILECIYIKALPFNFLFIHYCEFRV